MGMNVLGNNINSVNQFSNIGSANEGVKRVPSSQG